MHDLISSKIMPIFVSRDVPADPSKNAAKGYRTVKSRARKCPKMTGVHPAQSVAANP